MVYIYLFLCEFLGDVPGIEIFLLFLTTNTKVTVLCIFLKVCLNTCYLSGKIQNTEVWGNTIPNFFFYWSVVRCEWVYWSVSVPNYSQEHPFFK